MAELRLIRPDLAELHRLADLTALRRRADGTFFESNYARGLLAYALVATRRPATVLEFGTGRGYMALAAARAMHEHDIDGVIYTVDVIAPDIEVDWVLRDPDGPRVQRWSRRAFWTAHFPPEWLRHVREMTYTSRRALAGWRRRRLPDVALAFVDGGHDYSTARHDLLGAVAIGAPSLGILGDDVVERAGFGVLPAVRQLFGDFEGVTLVPVLLDEFLGRQSAMAWIDLASQEDLQQRLHAVWDAERGIRTIALVQSELKHIVSTLRRAVRSHQEAFLAAT